LDEINPTYCDHTQALEIGAALQSRHLTLAVAESCTGGRIASQITAVPGASRYFESAYITYSNSAKIRLLSVPKALIEKKGAVSSEVAHAMAEGVRKHAGADLGLSVTGIAGPGGGSRNKPVGLVYIALSDEHGTQTTQFLFSGNRNTIQRKASDAALKTLLMHLRTP